MSFMKQRYCLEAARHTWLEDRCIECGIFQNGTWERVLHDFWAKVEKTSDCWLWKGSRVRGIGKNKNGHARYQIRGADIYAHRFSWIIDGGLIPRGLEVLHKCDNPMCVRPDHLFLGTQRDNMHDMLGKGRGRYGPNRPSLVSR